MYSRARNSTTGIVIVSNLFSFIAFLRIKFSHNTAIKLFFAIIILTCLINDQTLIRQLLYRPEFWLFGNYCSNDHGLININRGVITTKASKASALVDFWDSNKLCIRNGPNSLADLKKKMSLFFYQAKKLLKFLCLFCRIGKINIILPSKKSF